MSITGQPMGNSNGCFIMSYIEKNSRREALHISVRFFPETIIVNNATGDSFTYVWK